MLHVICLQAILASDLMLSSVQYVTKCLSGLLPKIFSFLSETDLETLIHTIAASSLDYCNSLVCWAWSQINWQTPPWSEFSNKASDPNHTNSISSLCSESIFESMLYIYCNSFLYTVILWVKFFFYLACQLSHSYRIFLS